MSPDVEGPFFPKNNSFITAVAAILEIKKVSIHCQDLTKQPITMEEVFGPRSFEFGGPRYAVRRWFLLCGTSHPQIGLNITYRGYPLSLNLNSNGAKKHRNRDDDLWLTTLDVDDDSLHAGEGTTINVDLLSGPEIRPWSYKHPGGNQCLYRLNLRLTNWNGSFSTANDLGYTRRIEHLEAVERRKLTEEISWEKWCLNSSDPVGPASLFHPKGQKGFKTAAV